MRSTRRTTPLLVTATVIAAAAYLPTDRPDQGDGSGTPTTAGRERDGNTETVLTDATVKYLAPGEFTTFVDGPGRLIPTVDHFETDPGTA